MAPRTAAAAAPSVCKGEGERGEGEAWTRGDRSGSVGFYRRRGERKGRRGEGEAASDFKAINGGDFMRGEGVGERKGERRGRFWRERGEGGSVGVTAARLGGSAPWRSGARPRGSGGKKKGRGARWAHAP
jgi:hypothetical protein